MKKGVAINEKKVSDVAALMNSHCGQNWKELDDDKFGFLKDVCKGTFEVGPSEECDSENEEHVCQCLDPEGHM